MFAAASLTEAFTQLAKTYQQHTRAGRCSLNFAGSDQLAAQIEQGVPADVYAAASPKYPEELQGENLLGDTTNFATNTLVLIVPADNPAHIKSVNDLTKGAKLVSATRPCRSARTPRPCSTNLGISDRDLNIVSKEQDVEERAAAKSTLGEADAGFVYVTDALAAGDKVKQIELPARLRGDRRVSDRYRLDSEADQEAAQQWIDLVMSSDGQQVLQDFAFGPPPST